MRFHPTAVSGAFIIESEPRRDERGYLARTFCEAEFRDHGLDIRPVQGYQSGSLQRGTVRGLHYQVAPALEAKLVRCIAGAIFDVILDMRPDSPTYLRSFGVELTAQGSLGLYVPPMTAHGTQALTDHAELLCLASHAYAPEHERGVRYDDLIFGRNPWPLPVSEISAKDRSWPAVGPVVEAVR